MGKLFATLLILFSSPAMAGGLCVQADGKVLKGLYLLREDGITESAGSQLTEAERKLEAAAARIADAACTNDPGVFSAVHVIVFEDATQVDLETLRGPADFPPKVRRAVALAYGSISLRPETPVVVTIRPVRVDGDGEPFYTAVLRDGKLERGR